jgi:hypothetical protein
MDKEVFINNFVKAIENQTKEGFYCFFTSRSKIVLLRENKQMSFDEFYDYLATYYFGHQYQVKRILHSKISSKIEFVLESKIESMIIEITSRRISLLEIFND